MVDDGTAHINKIPKRLGKTVGRVKEMAGNRSKQSLGWSGWQPITVFSPSLSTFTDILSTVLRSLPPGTCRGMQGFPSPIETVFSLKRKAPRPNLFGSRWQLGARVLGQPLHLNSGSCTAGMAVVSGPLASQSPCPEASSPKSATPSSPRITVRRWAALAPLTLVNTLNGACHTGAFDKGKEFLGAHLPQMLLLLPPSI